MRHADDRGLRHRLMQHQRALDFGSAHPVTADVDDVIDAAGDPIVTVRVTAAAVSGEIAALVGGEIGLEEPLGIAPHAAHLTRPAFGDAQPGFIGTAPGIGAIMMPPVSVCHQASTIGARPSPTTS
ncbi:hypothetical protein WR25_14100 [Diploscapter pachys]|uniref:Uncharacterized protein n=1 Tax=Diploscapter pachys TaxID=2018661 RepID=A0A2A2M568_9BILA|nr:hypothetical protein WR25_14100 [Diploscapter pachys]